MGITFKGVAEGGLFEASAQMDGVPVLTRSVNAWQVPQPVPTLGITLRNNGAVAPAVVVVEVSTSNFLVPHDELHFEINFGDPGTSFDGVPTNVIALHGDDANTARIDIAGHIYHDSQPHTVTVTVSDGFNTVIETDTVQLVDHSVPLDHQIFVDPAGMLDQQHPGAPAGAVYCVTLNQAHSIYEGLTGDVILWLRDDRVFTPASSAWTGNRSLMIRRYGNGTNRPRINVSSGTGIEVGLDNGQNFLLDGIAVIGARSPEGASGAVTTGFRMRETSDADFLVLRSVLSNNGINGYVLSIAGGQPLQCFANTEFYAHTNYDLLWPSSFRGLVIGCRITADPSGWVGGRGKGSAQYNQHGNIRWSAPRGGGYQVIQQTDLFNNIDHSSTAVPPARTGAQPCVRWNFSQLKNRVFRVDRAYTEGSSGLNISVGKNTPNRCNVIVQSHMHVFSAQARGQAIVIDAAGTTIRAPIIVTPNVAHVQSGEGIPQAFSVYNGGEGDADQINTPVKVLNPTLIDDREGANQPFTAIQQVRGGPNTTFANFHYTNELRYLAGSSFQSFRDAVAPFSLSSPITPYYQGYQSFYEPVQLTQFATPQDVDCLVTLQPGSPALDAEPGAKRALTDFLGRLHTQGQGAVAL